MAFTPLKYKFDKELLELLSDKITSEGASFDRERFRKTTQPLLDPLELKDRVNVIADQLNFFLPGDYKSKLNLLLQILGPKHLLKETGLEKKGCLSMQSKN